MNQTYTKTYPISWDQLHRDSRALAWRLLDMNFFRGIVAVTRGGMVPAAIVARELDIHMVDTVCVTSYDWQDQQGEIQILKPMSGDDEGWLIIDDLVDTGRTAEVVRELLPKAHFATVYAKPAGKPMVDTPSHSIKLIGFESSLRVGTRKGSAGLYRSRPVRGCSGISSSNCGSGGPDITSTLCPRSLSARLKFFR